VIAEVAAPGRITRAWTETTSVEPATIDPGVIAGFAIDAPRAGSRAAGEGLEIAGWVIGQGAPVRGVRVVNDGRSGPVVQLDLRRPDVAAAYPAVEHAGASGFSVWAPLNSNRQDHSIVLEAVLPNGAAVTLGAIRARLAIEQRRASPGSRLVTAPDFVIIGAQRGGTTSMYAYLTAHPRVVPASAKELHYLTDRHERGPDWYLGQFPAELPAGTLTGEATPYALYHPQAPRRLHAIAPRAKLIALLRNPVDRAYSHYALERARGDETLDFGDALDAEPERLAGEEAKLAQDPTHVSWAHKHHSYIARGAYAPQLARWFEFFPREQMLVLGSEDLYERTEETFGRVTAFLGIGAGGAIPFAAHNRGSGKVMEPEIRRRLSEHFSPLNMELTDVLGWNPGWR
jgi:hypothetical protein